MPEYIEREALKKRLEDFSKWCKDGRKQGVDFVLDCPLPDIPTADVVEVVRCKTCRHYDCENKTCMRMSVEPEAYGEGIYIKMQENDFCSYGERKEE